MSVGSLNLTVTSPVQAFAEPLTIEEVRSFLELPEIDPPDSERTLMLESFIAAARKEAEIQVDVDLVRKQWDLYHDYFCSSYQVELLRQPLVSVDLVRYRNSEGTFTNLVEGTDYIVDLAKKPGVVLPAYGVSWPSFTAYPSGAVLIRFTSGYAATDAFWADEGKSIKLGMLYLISSWFNNRLPFEMGNSQGIGEYPWTVSALLRSVPRIG